MTHVPVFKKKYNDSCTLVKMHVASAVEYLFLLWGGSPQDVQTAVSYHQPHCNVVVLDYEQDYTADKGY